ncbi:hypothetical protein QL285_049282 [Trifolium repens]|nr:hypothetical protein QL285_049282 [Trifolium repens]
MDSSLDLGSVTSVLGFGLCWLSCALCFSVFFRSVEICRSQGLGFPPLFARKSFYACCLFRGLLARGSDSVLAVDPFAKLRTLVDLAGALTFHIFL